MCIRDSLTTAVGAAGGGACPVMPGVRARFVAGGAVCLRGVHLVAEAAVGSVGAGRGVLLVGGAEAGSMAVGGGVRLIAEAAVGSMGAGRGVRLVVGVPAWIVLGAGIEERRYATIVVSTPLRRICILGWLPPLLRSSQ